MHGRRCRDSAEEEVHRDVAGHIHVQDPGHIREEVAAGNIAAAVPLRAEVAQCTVTRRDLATVALVGHVESAPRVAARVAAKLLETKAREDVIVGVKRKKKRNVEKTRRRKVPVAARVAADQPMISHRSVVAMWGGFLPVRSAPAVCGMWQISRLTSQGCGQQKTGCC